MKARKYDWDRPRMRDLMRKPATSVDVLEKANDKGEIGYAHGGDGGDWPAVQECLDQGWIKYSHDASVGGRFDIMRGPFQRRDIYVLTALGRERLGLPRSP
jgi:hypothetical protein